MTNVYSKSIENEDNVSWLVYTNSNFCQCRIEFHISFFSWRRHIPTRNATRIKTIVTEIQVILKGIISKRDEARKAGETPSDDLLDLLLVSNSGETKGNGLTTEEIIEDCKLFYFAGQETTSVLLTWTMVLLSQHQDWQACVREEVMQVFGDRDPDLEGIKQLKVVSIKPNKQNNFFFQVDVFFYWISRLK